MSAAPYASAADVLTDRIRWTMAMLLAAVNRGRAEGWIDGSPVPVHAPDALADELAARVAVTGEDPSILTMRWLQLRLDLTAAQADLLWLLACIELAPAASRLTRALGGVDGDVSLQVVRFLLSIDDASLTSLVELGLIEMIAAPHVTHQRRSVRVADRVLALARGELEIDSELSDVVELVAPRTDVGEPAALVVQAISRGDAPLVVAVGPVGSGRCTALTASAATAGLATLRIDAHQLATGEVLRRQMRGLLREARLFGALPLFRELDATMLEPGAPMHVELARFEGPVMATLTTTPTLRGRPVVVHAMRKPDAAARAAIWTAHLDSPEELRTRAAEQYALWPGAIVAACRSATAGGAVTSFDQIHDAVRAHFGDQLEGLATRVDWRQTWDDLVLPPDQFEQLVELVARVRHRAHVLERWGFGAKVGKGTGVAALLSGPPGTGKTMAAGLIAQELGLDLYQVDLSKVVSKYIGETEKQLAKIFDAAESGQAVILFDEADALFAKRTEVKSSNDRFANLEVNYLLQRLEAFTGIVLLTTNHERAIDEAFKRRLSLHVRFPMPDEDQRVALWQAMLPAAADVSADLRFDQLAAEFEMSGGYIKNAVLRAAYAAVDEQSPISMKHLRRAARAEYESMGKIAFDAAA